MNEVIFDFNRISSIEDFYTIAAKKLRLPDHFGKNLDALWDCITGDIALPATVKFSNLSLNQLEQFDQLILLFEDAASELNDDFNFEYYIRNDGSTSR